MGNVLDLLDDVGPEQEKEKSLIGSVLPPIELSDSQKLKILKAWNEDDIPSIEELCDLCWPGMNLDGRSKHGKSIKQFLIEKDLKAKTKTEYQKKGLLELTEANKEYIKNNCVNMKAKEMAEIIFSKNNLMPVSQEAKTVAAYIKELEGETGFTRDIEDDTTDEYNPPKTFEHCVKRINRYIRDSKFDAKNLSSQQKKNCQMLISYLHSYRLNHQVNALSKQDDRDLFESVFISYCYDKPDLTREDIDKMIILATESVISANKLRMIEILQVEMQKSLDDNSNVKMGIVDSINTINTEYNGSVKRQRELYNDLNEKRSERLKGKIKESASVLHLVELWKNEESRERMIKIANQKRDKVKAEIDRLEDMDDLIASISGLSKEEALNG